MSEYLAYTSGVVRLFSTLDDANAWLVEVGGGKVFADAARLAEAEAARVRLDESLEDEVKSNVQLTTEVTRLRGLLRELYEHEINKYGRWTTGMRHRVSEAAKGGE